MDRGFGFVVLYVPAVLVCVTPLHVFCLHCVWSTMYVHTDQFTFLVVYHWSCYWISSQVVNVVVVGPVQLFSIVFRWVCIFFLFVALCFGPVFLRTISFHLNRFFPGQGAAGFVHSSGRLSVLM